ncbi:MAG: prlF antitoxin for toxin YhaV toxin [Thermoanaerobaculia bacterium]|jgi:AbrB family looped-hinge helix DNA binding protein|nr:prlF antitoxin for toxin YhaV toxin [Thermoanaerobaculia bacterium]
MPVSTIISRGRTTIPKEVRNALDLHAGDQLTWKISGGRVAIAKRPGFFRWEGVIKHGPADAVQAVAEARKNRGRI